MYAININTTRLSISVSLSRWLGVYMHGVANKRSRRLKEQSRMENPEKLATPGRQDTGRRQTRHNTKTKKKNEQHLTHKKPEVKLCAREG